MAVAQRAQPFVETGDRGNEAHVTEVGLDDHRRDVLPATREQRRHAAEIIEWRREGQLREPRGHAGAVRQPQRSDARAGFDQKRVGVAVISALELHDAFAPGRGARQPDRGHRGLGARIDAPQHLEGGHTLAYQLGELDLRGARRAVGPASPRGVANRRQDGRVRMAQNQRPPRADVVDVRLAVGIGEPATLGPGHEKGRPAHRPERPHRGVHAPGQHLFRPLEQLLRAGHGSATASKS